MELNTLLSSYTQFTPTAGTTVKSLIPKVSELYMGTISSSRASSDVNLRMFVKNGFYFFLETGMDHDDCDHDEGHCEAFEYATLFDSTGSEIDQLSEVTEETLDSYLV